MRVGIGFDTHRFANDRRLVLGGVTVSHDRGLEGHSDADVLSHAIVDALLGALALGNIGTRFSNDDERWKGADSRVFLRDTAGRIRERGFRIGNLDSTIIAESPLLAPYVGDMRAELGKTLEVDVDLISVKATTAESMGALGRSEGIACLAIACLEPR